MAAHSTILMFTPQVMLSEDRTDVLCTFIPGVAGGDMTGAGSPFSDKM